MVDVADRIPDPRGLQVLPKNVVYYKVAISFLLYKTLLFAFFRATQEKREKEHLNHIKCQKKITPLNERQKVLIRVGGSVQVVPRWSLSDSEIGPQGLRRPQFLILNPGEVAVCAN